MLNAPTRGALTIFLSNRRNVCAGREMPLMVDPGYHEPASCAPFEVRVGPRAMTPGVATGGSVE
jgi:hypothetical protein